MPILDADKLGEPQCQNCGRIASKIHCPDCGSYVVYARSDKFNIVRTDPATGDNTMYRSYRCRRCGLYFNDWQWRNECHAPQYATNEMRRRERDEYISGRNEAIRKALTDPDKLKSILNQVNAKRGMPMIDKIVGNVHYDKDGNVLNPNVIEPKDPDVELIGRVLNSQTKKSERFIPSFLRNKKDDNEQ